MALMFAFMFAVSLFLFIIINCKKLNKISTSLLLIPLLLTIDIIATLFAHSKEPTAMDVYRGKTTLEITYKDGVATDSTVIWKINN